MQTLKLTHLGLPVTLAFLYIYFTVLLVPLRLPRTTSSGCLSYCCSCSCCCLSCTA